MPTRFKVESRVRIKGDHREEVQCLLDEMGISPVRVIDREDGHVTFEIGALEKGKQLAMLNAIPRAYFSLKAAIRS